MAGLQPFDLLGYHRTEVYSRVGHRKPQGTANISKSCILEIDRLRKPRLEPDRVSNRRTKSGSFRTGRCRADVRERSFIATSCLSRPRKSRQRMIKKPKSFPGWGQAHELPDVYPFLRLTLPGSHGRGLCFLGNTIVPWLFPLSVARSMRGFMFAVMKAVCDHRI